jgi:hypothetical protein
MARPGAAARVSAEGAAFLATARPQPWTNAYAAVAGEFALLAPRRGARAERSRSGALDALEAVILLPPEGAVEAQGTPIEMVGRWRLIESLGGVRESVLNPYQPGTLKGDRPIYGRDWFLELSLESSTVLESGRRPSGVHLSAAEGAARRRGSSRETYARQTVTTSLALIRGNTVFRPPDWQLRFSGELSYRSGSAPGLRLLGGDPLEERRSQRSFGLRELFVERHLATKSERYDFDSLRVGVQPFVSDYRCFVLCEQQPGVRLFGNFSNNRFQYNLAWFRRLKQDVVSKQSTLELLRDDLFVANGYAQDLPVLGFSLQGTLIYSRGREAGESVSLGAAAADRSRGRRSLDRDVVYLGVSGDGHLDRLNLSFSTYGAFGSADGDPLSAGAQDIRAFFAALEASIDFDWYRLKLFALYASGDRDPADGRAGGFTALGEQARFGGLEESFLYREPIPLAAQPRAIALGGGLLPRLRSARSESLSSFIQPGLRAAGLGGEFDVLPELRISVHASYLDFDDTSSFSALLSRERPGGTRAGRHIGEDASAVLTYRPLFINNVLVRASLAALRPGSGLDDVLGTRRERWLYTSRVEVVLRY